jgi:hypothetical protein
MKETATELTQPGTGNRRRWNYAVVPVTPEQPVYAPVTGDTPTTSDPAQQCIDILALGLTERNEVLRGFGIEADWSVAERKAYERASAVLRAVGGVMPE